jgi:hypothetical protein
MQQAGGTHGTEQPARTAIRLQRLIAVRMYTFDMAGNENLAGAFQPPQPYAIHPLRNPAWSGFVVGRGQL